MALHERGADAGERLQRGGRLRPDRGDGVQGAVVGDDVGRHRQRARRLAAPRPQRLEQLGIDVVGHRDGLLAPTARAPLDRHLEGRRRVAHVAAAPDRRAAAAVAEVPQQALAAAPLGLREALRGVELVPLRALDAPRALVDGRGPRLAQRAQPQPAAPHAAVAGRELDRAHVLGRRQHRAHPVGVAEVGGEHLGLRVGEVGQPAQQVSNTQRSSRQGQSTSLSKNPNRSNSLFTPLPSKVINEILNHGKHQIIDAEIPIFRQWRTMASY